MPDGSYKWLGFGRAVPKGEPLGSTPAPAAMVASLVPKDNCGRKVAAKVAMS